MTGFGAATREDGTRRVTVEVRTLNHRYLKIGLKVPRALAALEPELEPLIRKHVRRGAVTVSCRFHDEAATPGYRIDIDTAREYRERIDELWSLLGLHEPCGSDPVTPLLSLPGVIRTEDEESDGAIDDDVKALVLGAVREALEALVEARRVEGEQTARILREHGELLEKHVDVVRTRAPEVPREHRDKLLQRARTLLEELGSEADVQESDLHRELCLIADKADVAEELNRLGTHLDRYRQILDEGGEAGRKLDFLLQEMLRETNTIGSKANDASIAHAVVEMKCEVERMKEQVQNLE